MKQLMVTLFTFLFPIVSFAQEDFVDYSDTYSILNTYSFLSVLLVGAITSVIVLRNAKKMSGGVFGDALGYFGTGMLIMLAGIVISIGVALFSKETISVLGNLFYIVGYLLMAFAADKIKKIIEGE